VPELIAKAPLEGRGDHAAGGAVLAPWDPGVITSIAAYPGAAGAVDAALAATGLALPAPGLVVEGPEGRRAVWTGREQAFVLGGAVAVALDGLAAVTDQTDGWAGLRLSGPAAVEVLARLVAVDLREGATPPGRVVRTGLNHVPAILIRGATGVEILVFRSMIRTAWEEIAEAMAHVAARAAVAP
jgi:sarcosine oxidase subunit gamma